MVRVVRGWENWVLENGKYRHELPVAASMETLAEYTNLMNGAIIRYGDRVLFAGAHFDGVLAAVYEFVDDDHECDSRLNLIWLNDVVYRDAGHALEACMNWVRNN